MSQSVKNRVFSLTRNGSVNELEHLLKCENIHWTECRHTTGDTPLHICASTGNIAVLKFLLENCDEGMKAIDATNAAGKTALHEACQNAKPEIVSYLLRKEANARALKQADWTPLMLACTKKGEDALSCCRLLIEKEGVVLLNDVNKDGWNALHIASREGDVKIVKELLNADPLNKQSTRKSNNGRTPLHTAALHGWNEVVGQLLADGHADCNVRDSCGSSPLHDAVRSGSIETFKELLNWGADKDACNNEGFGILHMAAQTGNLSMLHYLLQEVKLDVLINVNEKTTPLHCAVRAGQVPSVKLLLEKGADPYCLDLWGRTCHDIIPEKNSNDIKSILAGREKSSKKE